MVLHPDDEAMFRRATEFGTRLAALIGETTVIEPKRRPLADGAEGVCYCEEKRIGLAFRFKGYADEGGAWARNPIPWSRIRETLAHEVAHLKHPDHSVRHKALTSVLMKALDGMEAGDVLAT
jgi:hypothetical protein